MIDWKIEAKRNLSAASSAFGGENYRQVLVLLDDAVALISQGHLHEIGKQPGPRRDGRSASVPAYLEALLTLTQPSMTETRLKMLRDLHEVRNVLVHRVDSALQVTKDQCLRFLREAAIFATTYGVELPTLMPTDLVSWEPIPILIEFRSEHDPRKLPPDLRGEIVKFCRDTGILAGIIANANWPLVRCCLCGCLVPIEQVAITQEDVMFAVPAAMRFYCDWGCGQAHQAWMRQQFGNDAYDSYSGDYYLQSARDWLPGIPHDWPTEVTE